MVVTVTLSPALDVTARLGTLRPGTLNRLDGQEVNAGGKGVNAAQLVRALGGETLAVGFAGGAVGEVYLNMLTATGLPHRFIKISGETRINMKILTSPESGRGTGRSHPLNPDIAGGGSPMTELNGPGSAGGEGAYRAMEALLAELCVPGTVFVLSGSLPPDAEPGLYARYIRMLRGGGAGVVLDTSGEALRLGASAQPDIVKPNREEIVFIDREAFGGLLVWSLGAEGVRFFRGKEEWFIPAIPIENASPAGAGDCMTGALAFALDKGMPFERAAVLSAAAAAAAASTPGTQCPCAALIKGFEGRLNICYHSVR